jgi:hypothetical protein
MAISNNMGAAPLPAGVVEFLNQKWRPGKICSVCGTGNWNVEPQLAELRFLSLAGFVVGGPIIPLIVLTCVNCGHTVLINAVKAGWQPPATEQVPREAGGL